MARHPKPWYRSDRKVWCVTIDGVRHYLGRDKPKAMERYHALMGRPGRQRVAPGEALPEIADAFLDWTERNRAPATYKWYRDHLQSFIVEHHALRVDQLRPHHVEKWASDGVTNVNTRRNRMRAVKRCLRWALAQGYIYLNPIVGLEIPGARPRDTYVPPEEFARLLSHVRDSRFADLLQVTYETGCRPQESLRVEARHFDPAHARWVFPRCEAKGREMPRAVYLTDWANAVTRRLVEEFPVGPLFRNSAGRPWTNDAIGCAFDRVQVRLGRLEMLRRGESIDERDVLEMAKTLVPHRCMRGVLAPKSNADLLAESRRKLTQRRAREIGARYSLYVLRHSWATNALKSGIDALTVAILMGHKDPSTLARTYQHLSHNPDHLLTQARRASGSLDRVG